MNYEQASSHESSDGFGIKIMVAMPGDRALSQQEREAIQDKGYDLQKELRAIAITEDPKTEEIAQQTKKELLECFPDTPIFAETIPNEYGDSTSDPYYLHSPWLLVTTRIGRIKIGWRKRVISIDWSDSTLIKTANELFPNEDVTKDDQLIHAWGYGKAKEYLAKIIGQEKTTECKTVPIPTCVLQQAISENLQAGKKSMKQVLLVPGKVYHTDGGYTGEFAYIGATGMAVFHPPGEPGMQDSWAVPVDQVVCEVNPPNKG